MRLWHKDLISKLPREQLVAQWRECSAIAGAIQKNGTPNHLLVNYVMDYPIDMFISYSILVREEMTRRGYKTMQSVMDKILNLKNGHQILNKKEIYPEIHNDTYYKICYWNLYEKWIRGGIEDKYAALLNFDQFTIDKI